MNYSISSKKSLYKFLFPILAATLVVSCTSSQQFYDSDGIYSGGETLRVTVPESTQEVSERSNSNAQIYKDYFGKEAEALDDLDQDGAVFTDIDSYSSEDDAQIYVDGVDFEANTGYGAWGDETQDIVVNVYNNGPLWGGGLGWNRGFGWGWGGLGWNQGFGWGWGSPWGWGGLGWNQGFGWGWGGPWGWGGGPWGWGAGFGWGGGFYGHHLAFGNGYYNGFHRGRNYGRIASYTAGRRSSREIISASRSRLRGNSGRVASTRSRATYAREKRSGRSNSNYRSGVNRGVARPNSTNRDDSGRVRPSARPSSTYRNGVNRVRPNATTRPNSRTRPSTTRPQGSTSRPSARPSRSINRPSARPSRSSSSRPSYSRPSSRSRSGSSMSRGGRSSSRSSGSRSGGRRGGSRG